MTHIYNVILLSHKKKRSWVICSEVDGPRDCHTEWSKSEKGIQIPCTNTYIWNLKKNGSDETRDRNKDTDVENGLEDTGRGKGKLGRSEKLALTYIHFQM